MAALSLNIKVNEQTIKEIISGSLKKQPVMVNRYVSADAGCNQPLMTYCCLSVFSDQPALSDL